MNRVTGSSQKYHRKQMLSGLPHKRSNPEKTRAVGILTLLRRRGYGGQAGPSPSFREGEGSSSFCARAIGDSGLSVTPFHIELGLFAFLLLGLNLPVFQGQCNGALLYNPAAVRAGEWWRLLTFPFIHVTWYHLLLDGSAFFFLYKELSEFPCWKRWAGPLFSAAGSLLVSIWADPSLEMKGLCGISGIAHGLMVITALDLMTKEDRTLYYMGLISFITVIAKGTFEAVTGRMLFTFLDFGMVGDPVAVTHAGGALGGLLFWLVTSEAVWKHIFGEARDGGSGRQHHPNDLGRCQLGDEILQ